MTTDLHDQLEVGIAASPGVALGPAVWKRTTKVEVIRRSLNDGDLAAEVTRFKDIVSLARTQIAALRAITAERMGEAEAAVFDAHVSFLDDPAYTGEIELHVRAQKVNAEVAVAKVTEEMGQMLAALPNEYLQARANDIRDVGDRLLSLLAGEQPFDPSLVQPGSVMVADDFAPSDLAAFPAGVAAMVTARGSRTSHVVIMAKALGIPAVVGLDKGLSHIADGAIIAVNGDQGTVLIDPSPEQQQQIQQEMADQAALRKGALAQALSSAVTFDDQHIDVFANIGSLKDIPAALQNGADGVGLFRTEFLYLENDHWPTEEEQYEVYRKALEAFQGKPVIIRTLDIGGDKPLPYADLPKEENPFLGYRAIRYCLDNVEIFKIQLRALLRASVGGQLWIMFPMVENLSEVRSAKAVLAQCRAELKQEGHPMADKIPVGIMVEIPAAAVTADVLAREVDFMSIGTNDLTQYTLAADRGNERIAYLYDAAHPAVLRLVRMTCEAGRKAGIPVGMCGELAGDIDMTEALVGFGLSELSMSSASIPLVKQRVRQVSAVEGEPWALGLLGLEAPEDVRGAARDRQAQGRHQ